MVQLAQFRQNHKADRQSHKPHRLGRQPQFGGGIQQQKQNRHVFIDKIGDKHGIFQTAFFQRLCAQNHAHAERHQHHGGDIEMNQRAQKTQIRGAGKGRLNEGKQQKQQQDGELIGIAPAPCQPSAERKQNCPSRRHGISGRLREKRQCKGGKGQRRGERESDGFQTAFIVCPVWKCG